MMHGSGEGRVPSAGRPGAREWRRTYTYRSSGPGVLTVLLLLPLALFFASFVALAVVTGVIGGLVLPFVLPWLSRRQAPVSPPADPRCIELDARDYRAIDSDRSSSR